MKPVFRVLSPTPYPTGLQARIRAGDQPQFNRANGTRQLGALPEHQQDDFRGLVIGIPGLMGDSGGNEGQLARF